MSYSWSQIISQLFIWFGHSLKELFFCATAFDSKSSSATILKVNFKLFSMSPLRTERIKYF